MVSLMVILFNTKCFLFVYMFIDLLKLKAYKLFENSDADLSWLFFLKEASLYISNLVWRTDNCLFKARQLLVLPSELNIFTTRQRYVLITLQMPVYRLQFLTSTRTIQHVTGRATQFGLKLPRRSTQP